MGITVAQQTWSFLFAIVLGAALGVCYDVFRIIRIAVVNPPALVVVEDILFALICASATLCYLIGIADGQLRAFILIGEAIGFVLYYYTIGALVIKISKGIIHIVKTICGWIFHILIRPFIRLFQWIGRIFYKSAKLSAKILRKSEKSVNKHLPIDQ